MQITQKMELRRYLAPQLNQSLNILALPLLDIKNLIENELESNPLLEETAPANTANESLPPTNSQNSEDLDFRISLITKKASLQEVLLRQLGMFTDTDDDFRIGQEIIGNIDGNGYLKASVDDIAKSLNVTADRVEGLLKLIQQFEPAGVAARTIAECLLIQLKLAEENDPVLCKIVECHLEDVAKKNYSLIAKSLKEPLDKIEPLIKKILKLDPKPGRNYSQEETQRIIPDVVIEEKDEDLNISVNNIDIPVLNINKTYKDMLEKDDLEPQAKEFLKEKLRSAQELLRAVSKRQSTLIKVMEVIVEVQQDAIRENLSHLKPLTFQDVAKRIEMHESTVCRAVMNKYIKAPYGIVALKDFFPSRIQGQNGESVSSSHVKSLIMDLIEQEDKKHPLSDLDICNILSKDKNLVISRRTVAKYREELKTPSSTYRKER